MIRSRGPRGGATPGPALLWRLGGTLLLLGLSILGQALNLPLFFGVQILFGSVAVWLAMVWLGTPAGLVVAVASGAYTYLLWDHPYAFLIFLAEAVFVGWHRARHQWEGRSMPPLPVSVGLYWLAIGVPLVVLFYRLPLDMSWSQIVLIAIKQSLNGILNAVLASLILILVALLRRQRRGASARQILFSLLLGAILLPSILIMGFDHRDLKDHMETELAERLRFFGDLVVHELEGHRPTDGDDSRSLDIHLDAMARRFAATLPESAELEARILPRARLDPRGRPVALEGIEDLMLILPARDGAMPSRIATWRAARYRLVLPVPMSAPDDILLIELSAVPLVDQVHERVSRVLTILLALAAGGILVADRLSRQLARPVQRLAATAVALPARITAGHALSIPSPGLLEEDGVVTDAINVMARGLAESFGALERERDAQSRQRALHDLQASMLVGMMHPADDERTAMGRLCRLVAETLPGRICVVLTRRMDGHFQVFADAGLTAAARPSLEDLLNRAGDDRPRDWTPDGLYPVLLEPRATAATAGDGASEGVGPGAPDTPVDWWCWPVIDRETGRLSILVIGTPPGASPDGFTAEVIETALGLAALAFDTLRTRRRHAVLLDALSRAGTGIVIATRHVDIDYRISFVNAGFERMTGYRAAEVMGRNCRLLQGQDRDQPERAQIREALAAGAPCQVTLRNYRKDGTCFYNALNLAPLIDSKGEVTHYVGIQQDLTAVHETLARLERSEALLKEAQATAHLGSWSLDYRSGELIWTDETYRLLGHEPGSVQASLETFFASVHPDDAAAIRAELEAAPQRADGAYMIEHRVLGPDGVERILHEQGRAHFAPDGTPLRLSGTCQDITAQRRVEDDLIRREAIERELLELAAQFVLVQDGDLSELIDRVLERIGRFTTSDRAYLFEFDLDTETMDNTHEWVADGVEPMMAQLQGLPIDRFATSNRMLAAGVPFVATHVSDLGDDFVAERDVLMFQGILSVLLVPLLRDDTLIGFVGFDATRVPRDWSEAEVRFLQVFSSILVSAFERARIDADLRASNARYDALAHQSRTMTWELDTSGRYTYVSPVIETILGYRVDEVVGGMRFDDLLPTASLAEVVAAVMEPLRAGRQFKDLMKPMRRADGGLAWCLSSGLPILDASGALIGYRGSDVEVTELHEAQERLAASEARMSAVFEYSPIGICTVGPNRRLTLVNRAMGEILGRDPQDLIGTRIDDLTHPDDLQHELALLAELRAGERDAYRVAKRYLKPDGTIVWTDLRVVLLPGRPGEPAIPLGMIEDITELRAETEHRRALERSMLRYAKHLEALVDLSSRTLAEHDELSALLELACSGTGLDGGEILAARPNGVWERLVSAPLASPGDETLDAEALEALMTEPGVPRVVQDESAHAPTRDGRGLAQVMMPLRWLGPGGQVTSRLVRLWGRSPQLDLSAPDRELIRLIGQRIMAQQFEAQLQAALISAKERETIGHLASGVAHDFNNLMGVIDANLSYLQMILGEGPTDPEILEIMDETQSALAQAKVVTSGMLSLSRAGGIPLQDVVLEQAIGELVAILTRILPLSIQLRLDLAPALGAHTNAAFLQAALLNLSLNARDAMPEGGELLIETRRVHWDGAASLAIGQLAVGDYAQVRVQDGGCGMSESIIARLFEPLFSTKAKQRGHGLGLFMVREFIQRSGAGLLLDSRPGAGTVFRVLMPLATDVPGALTQPLLPLPEPEQVAPRRVLVVDDDPRVRESIGRLLSLDGMRVLHAANGAEALERLRREPNIELVLSDLAMPVMDGTVLWRVLAEERPELPILLMTGQDPELVRVDAWSEPPPVLSKPIDQRALHTALAAIATRAAARRERSVMDRL